MSASLLQQLVERGDQIAVINGRIKIKPASGKAVPADWLKKMTVMLAAQIGKATRQSLFMFVGHTVGIDKGHSQDRLTLQFSEIGKEERVVVHFNVSARYARSTANREKGDRLPKGRFNPRPGSRFVSFWNELALPKPRKPSEYNEKLYLLKPLLFTGRKGDKARFENKCVKLANIDFDTIENGLMVRQEVANEPPVDRQWPANLHRQEAGRNACAPTDFEESDCVSDKVRLKLISSRVKGKVDKPVMEQTIDEWLEGYGEL